MFFALSEQLDVVKGMRISHEEIRQTVYRFLRDNPTLVSTILAVTLLYFMTAFVTVQLTSTNRHNRHFRDNCFLGGCELML